MAHERDPQHPNERPGGLEAMKSRYLEWLQVRNYSEQTIDGRRYTLNRFIRWCEDRDLNAPCELTKQIIENYQRYVFLYRQKNGKPLSPRYQYAHLGPVKYFLKWLTRENFIPHNPAADIVLPRIGQSLPMGVLSAKQVEEVLSQADFDRPLGVRDRAIMETFYSTGMRRKELARLEVQDVKPAHGVIAIRSGKGDRDRVVPVGKRALAWILRYIDEVRTRTLIDQDAGPLFVSQRGGPLSPGHLTGLCRKYFEKAGIPHGACHLFRHSMATAMLENGADVRYVQEMLGHAKLSTTQIYTHVAITKLKEIHAKTHPARFGRPSECAATSTPEVDES